MASTDVSSETLEMVRTRIAEPLNRGEAPPSLSALLLQIEQNKGADHSREMIAALQAIFSNPKQRFPQDEAIAATLKEITGVAGQRPEVTFFKLPYPTSEIYEGLAGIIGPLEDIVDRRIAELMRNSDTDYESLNTEELTSIGLCHLLGLGVAADQVSAFNFFHKAFIKDNKNYRAAILLLDTIDREESDTERIKKAFRKLLKHERSASIHTLRGQIFMSLAEAANSPTLFLIGMYAAKGANHASGIELIGEYAAKPLEAINAGQPCLPNTAIILAESLLCRNGSVSYRLMRAMNYVPGISKCPDSGPSDVSRQYPLPEVMDDIRALISEWIFVCLSSGRFETALAMTPTLKERDFYTSLDRQDDTYSYKSFRSLFFRYLNMKSLLGSEECKNSISLKVKTDSQLKKVVRMLENAESNPDLESDDIALIKGVRGAMVWYKDIEGSPAEAEALVKEAAKGDCRIGTMIYSVILQGKGEKDRAQQYLEKAAKLGSPRALFLLGAKTIYEKQDATPEEIMEAISQLFKASTISPKYTHKVRTLVRHDKLKAIYRKAQQTLESSNLDTESIRIVNTFQEELSAAGDNFQPIAAYFDKKYPQVRGLLSPHKEQIPTLSSAAGAHGNNR